MSPAEYHRTLQQAASRAVRVLRAELTATALDAERQGKELARARLRSRTGQLVRSIRGEVTEAGDLLELRLSAGRDRQLRYAAMQEYGGTIRPKRARWLTIPVGAALTPAGVPRYASAREAGQLRFVPIDGARALLVRDRRGRSDILYVLRKRSTIREKSFMRDAFSAATRDLQDRLSGKVAGLLIGGDRGE